MTQEELDKITEKIGKEAADQIKREIDKAEKAINDKNTDLVKGLMTQQSFDAFKKETIEPINELLKKVEDASKAQGTLLKAYTEKAAPNSKSFEDFIAEQVAQVREKRPEKGYVEFTAAELKAAGVMSIGSTIVPASPYAPGISGDLEIFDIMRNPNFITNRVDLGRTNSPILAWANETGLQGAPAVVAEGGLKPQISRTYKIETSTAIKIAAWMEFTDEFVQDLPGFATNARRKLQEDVIRFWDDAIQQFAQSKARPFNINQLDDDIDDANYWDAIMAMLGQIGFNNYTPNGVALNWLTNVAIKTQKNTNGTYLLPPFLDDLRGLMTYSNKMSYGYALAGDFKQLHVDIYKDFVVKVGWINDEFIYNKFAVVGELRYHNYISDARRDALVYDYLGNVATRIDGQTGS